MVTLDEISHLVGKTIYDGLARDGGTRFEALKKEAMQRINAIAGTNLTPSGTRPQSLDWVVTPFAWIVEYIALAHYQNISGEYLEYAKYKYKEALDICSANASPVKTGRHTSIGTIDGAYEL